MFLIDLTSHLIISLVMTMVFWPYLGAVSLAVVLLATAYLVRAWMDADLIVAEKAGFRRPTLVQQRYLDYLGTGQGVFTHPSLLPIAGVLASSKRRLIVLTSGTVNELSETDFRQLIAKLSSRDRKAIFSWTFHLATGAAGLFSRSDRNDPFAQSWADWGRKTLMVGVMGGVAAVILAVLIAAPISMVYRNPLDISPIVPILWLPFIYLGAKFVWRRGNAALIKPAAGNWNTSISLEKATFVPMSMPRGGHSNLNILRHGLLIADKQHLSSLETEADFEHRLLQ